MDVLGLVDLALLPEQFLGTMLGSALALVFLARPLKRGSEQVSPPWYDWIAAILGLLAGWHVGINYDVIGGQLFFAPPLLLAEAAVIFVLCLEGLRRTAGYALLIIVLFFIGYATIGHLMPGAFETREVSFERLIVYVSLDASALFGLPLIISTTVVITFIFFGQLLSVSGGSQFFNDISMALMGRYRGGSAKIAIMASSLFGSVSGVAVSNIVATGVVTIPMMKKGGYSPRLAGAIEAVASTGGQLMPPVMGAVAFLMADFLEMPYRTIVIAALVPSLIYYVALFIQADLEAAKNKILPIDPALIERSGAVMRKGGAFLLPFAALIYALFWLNWRPETAAILACAVTLAVGVVLGYGGMRVRPVQVWTALIETGHAVLDILMIVAGAGFIIGVLQVTGLGFALTALLVDMGGNNLVLLLIIAALMCIVLGMGMPTLGVYVLLAVLVAPALVEVGVKPLAAHMFILYLGMMSLITPPVAIAAFFAAGLAKAPPMATGWAAMRFGWTAYFVPFLFVFSPSLLLQEVSLNTVGVLITAIAGVWFASAGLIGYFRRPLTINQRALFIVAGLCLLLPADLPVVGLWTDAIGIALGALIVFREFIAKNSRRQAA